MQRYTLKKNWSCVLKRTLFKPRGLSTKAEHSYLMSFIAYVWLHTGKKIGSTHPWPVVNLFGTENFRR